MTNKELIEAFRSQTKYVKFGRFLDNYDIPEEETEDEEVHNTNIATDELCQHE